MKKILLSIILLIFPLSVIAEWVCPAPAGCKIVLETGECIGCIKVEEPPIIKEEVVVEKKPITRKKNWVGTLWKCVVGCKVGVSYWDDDGNEFDENRNLISTN